MGLLASYLVEVLHISMQKGRGVEGRQADRSEAFGGLQEGLAGGDEIAQHQQVALSQDMRPSLGNSTDQVSHQHDAKHC